ncbi:hypothetical protein [Hyphomicrobium sp.]|uniref:hypothetical protein n=1 Tax=Hyphomicrobium sp. TaxID=82 RepID=UPI000FB9ED85|nr:hypothetical protein [Hyphomicrobium sp.]RUP08057.1 MAG: hypothetical protein EKK38_16055 [Hyphomicrobium sp.]
MSLSKLSNRHIEGEPAEPVTSRGPQRHWVEIFSDRVTERLKEILQEEMDWMTSRPILERLNRLYDLEQARETDAKTPDIIRPSVQRPESSK